MPGTLRLPLDRAAAGPVSGPEAAFLGVLLGLALLAILIEVIRRLAGRPSTPPGQFWLRMVGGVVMLLLVGIITFGVLFVRPEDGRVFGWYWACSSLVLLGIVLILRKDVASTTSIFLEERLRLRDERLGELRSLADDWERKKKQPNDVLPTALESQPDPAREIAPDEGRP